MTINLLYLCVIVKIIHLSKLPQLQGNDIIILIIKYYNIKYIYLYLIF